MSTSGHLYFIGKDFFLVLILLFSSLLLLSLSFCMRLSSRVRSVFFIFRFDFFAHSYSFHTRFKSISDIFIRGELSKHLYSLFFDRHRLTQAMISSDEHVHLAWSHWLYSIIVYYTLQLICLFTVGISICVRSIALCFFLFVFFSFMDAALRLNVDYRRRIRA